MIRIVTTLAAVVAALAPVSAVAQDPAEVTLHSRGHYKGARLVLDGPARAMNLPFLVKSVSISPGTSWELCSGNTFTGCRRFSQSVPAMVMTVRSARPVGTTVAVPGGTVSAQGSFEPAGPSPSLRGMASEYFVAPDRGGRRIEVNPATPDEASRRANDYCRSIGWTRSVHGDVQVAGGVGYLADVLCVRTNP